MAYVYHYHAMSQPSPGVTSHNDGVVMCDLPIDSSDRFDSVRETIADHIGIHASNFNITSLTLLNPYT